jgi:hypothetical protein
MLEAGPVEAAQGDEGERDDDERHTFDQQLPAHPTLSCLRGPAAVLEEPAWADRLTAEDRRGLSARLEPHQPPDHERLEDAAVSQVRAQACAEDADQLLDPARAALVGTMRNPVLAALWLSRN